VSRELEDHIDDGPIDDDDLDGPENGEDVTAIPASRRWAALTGMATKTGWAAGGQRDLELVGAELGIGDADGLHEQVGTQDGNRGYGVMDKPRKFMIGSALEEPMHQARNLAMAARMIGSASEMPKDAVADLIFMKLVEIMDEKVRIFD
jgi:hypothetical protein